MKSQDNRAVILARVSTKGQEDEGYSLDAQVKLMRIYCENNGLRVAEVFKVAETASKSAQRNIFKGTIKFIEDNGIKHLIIEKVDRHVRNLHDAVQTHDWLMADEDKAVHFVKDSLVMHKDSKSQEWLNWGLRVVMAKNYVDNLREEAMKGWAEKLAQGWLPAVPPIGYMTITENGKRIHVPNPKTYKSMQKAFRLYLDPSQSIESVTTEMGKMGLTTRFGRPLTDSAVHMLLQNPFYIGINRFNGKDTPGAQQCIISKELFAAVQTKRTRGRPIKQRRHNPLFKNLISCMHCNKTITWQLQKGRMYGSCQRDLPACKKQKFIREEDIMQCVNTMLDDLISPSERIVSWLTNLLRSDYQLTINNVEEAQKALKERIGRLKRMDEVLYDDKLTGDISPERYKEKHEAFTNEIKTLTDQLGGISQEYETAYHEGISIIELSQVAKAQFLDENIDVDDKRTILTKLFENITFKDNFVSVTYTKMAQAVAHKSNESWEILAYAKQAQPNQENCC